MATVANKRIRATAGKNVLIRMIRTSAMMRHGSLELYVPHQVRERQLMGTVMALPLEDPTYLGLALGDIVIVEDQKGRQVDNDGLFIVPGEAVLARLEKEKGEKDA